MTGCVPWAALLRAYAWLRLARLCLCACVPGAVANAALSVERDLDRVVARHGLVEGDGELVIAAAGEGALLAASRQAAAERGDGDHSSDVVPPPRIRSAAK